MKGLFISILAALSSLFGLHHQQTPSIISTTTVAVNVQPQQTNPLTATNTPLSIQITNNIPQAYTGTSTVSIPPLPAFLNWTLDTTQPHSMDYTNDVSGVTTSIPANKWIATLNGQDSSGSESMLNEFKQYYDSVLTPEGWSTSTIDLPSGQKLFNGSTNNQWNYSKIDNGYLYQITLGYEASSTNPGTVSYDVFVISPVSVDKLEMFGVQPVSLYDSDTQIGTTTGTSTVTAPPLPSFINWTQDTSDFQSVDISSSTSEYFLPALEIDLDTSTSPPTNNPPSVPVKEWIAIDKDQSGNTSGTTTGQFEQYYDTILPEDGWSANAIDLPNAVIDGPGAGGEYGNYWSYLKISNGNLYMIALGYNSSPSSFDDSQDGMGYPICPCPTSYEVEISDPIPLKLLGL